MKLVWKFFADWISDSFEEDIKEGVSSVFYGFGIPMMFFSGFIFAFYKVAVPKTQLTTWHLFFCLELLVFLYPFIVSFYKYINKFVHNYIVELAWKEVSKLLPEEKEKLQRNFLQQEIKIKDGVKGALLEARSERANIEIEKQNIKRSKEEIEKIVGISYSDFVDLVYTDKNSWNWNYPRFRERAKAYIDKIKERQRQINLSASQKPIITAVATQFREEFNEILEKPTNDFLNREKNLCAEKAAEDGLIVPEWWNEKVEVDVVHVRDGDTVIVKVKKTSKEYVVRIIGFDTPETVHPKKDVMHWGPESSKNACKIFADAKKVEIKLDSVGVEQDCWINDRYGRLLAHVYVDDVLFGKRMLETGNARTISVFPMEKNIKDLYRVCELTAKSNNLGLWLEMNKLDERRKTIINKSRFQKIIQVMETEQEMIDTKAIVQQQLKELISHMMVKSKNSYVAHELNCHHARKIQSNRNAQNISSDDVDGVKFVNCKVCNGDPLVKELYS
jgi:micrococcal nuclease